MPRRRRAPDPATSYARKVVAGKILAGKLVRQACERHLSDLKTAPARGFRWEPSRAWRAITFLRTLKLTKGRWVSKYFDPQPWQCFVIGSIWGWRRADGTRRFRVGYLEIPRKNGKTELAGACLLLGGFFDDPPEYAAENYPAATKKDQARLAFNAARTMGRRSPSLRTRLTFRRNRIIFDASESFIEPLGRDSENLDGLNPHFSVIDELHAHASSGIVDVLETATGARSQSFQLEITTAGGTRLGVCWDHHEYSVQLLDPKSGFLDDTWFAYIATIDEGDVWDQERTWRKANPNFGVTIPKEWFEGRLPRARKSPSARAAFMQKNLDVWVGGAEREIDIDTWDRGNDPIDLAALKGRRCFAGLDLAKTNDISALALVFPPITPEEPYQVLMRYWVPEEDIEAREVEHKVPYAQWAREKRLVVTEGEITDYDFIEHDLAEVLPKQYDVHELAFDRHYAESLQRRLSDHGITVVAFGQGYVSMSDPTNEFLRLYRTGRLRHGGDPVLRWMAGNLVLAKDPAGNVKPDKARGRDKIDGIVALVMALGRAMVTPAPPPKPTGQIRVLG